MGSSRRGEEWGLLARHGPEDLVAWAAPNAAFTAADLRRHAAILAARLRLSDGEGEALLLCRDRYAFAVSALAVWQSGCPVALPPNLGRETLAELASSDSVRAVLHDGNWPHGIDVSAMVADPHRPADTPQAPLALRGDQPVAFLYTSGSTGRSRRTAKVAAQLFGEARLLGEVLGIARGDRVLSTVPSQHIYGLLAGLLTPLLHGAAMVCGSPLLAEEVAALAREGAANVLVSVPAHLRSFSTLAPEDIGGVRLIVSSSAPLDPPTAATLARFPAEVVELFGSTETGGLAVRRLPEERWRPLPGIAIAAAGDGTMLVDSPFLDPGAPRPYAGADRIEVGEDGLFRHLGRGDGVLKIAGRRVVLEEIESRLRAVEGVVDASVTAVAVEGGRAHEIWAMAVAPALDADTIRRRLIGWLDPVMLPRRLRLVSALPRETTGKIPRERWLAVFEEGVRRGEIVVEARRFVPSPGAQRREVEVRVPADLAYFEGHFDRYPVLPGAAILSDIVLAESALAWPELTSLRRLSQVKFRRPIRPGDGLALRLTRQDGSDSVDFELRCGGRPCSSGTLEFASPP
jgi:acyl-coenzyme A synthetase/AMP-(fatty) acid ligase